MATKRQLEQRLTQLQSERNSLVYGPSDNRATYSPKGLDVYTKSPKDDRINQIDSEIESIRRKISLHQYTDEPSYGAGSNTRNQEYTYMENGVIKSTHQKSLAARYKARDRFYKMSKTKQAMAKLTGKYKKFERAWYKSVVTKEEDEKLARELDAMFKRR